MFVLGVYGANFAPYGFLDLSVGRRGGDDDGFVVRHEPPYCCESGGVCFSGGVTGTDGDESVVPDGVENLLLLFPRGFAEFVLDEPYGGVARFIAVFGGGCRSWDAADFSGSCVAR